MIEIPFSWSAAFVLNNERVNVVVETRRHNAQPYVSFTGDFDGGTGQIMARLREAAQALPVTSDEYIADLCDAWDALHMKQVADLSEQQAGYLESVQTTLLMLNGERYGAPGSLEDIGDAEFSNSNDVIDSREIIKRIEELEGAFEAAGLDWKRLLPGAPDYDDQGQGEDSDAEACAVELKVLKDLESEAEGYAPDWKYGATLIRESYFTEYAEEMVKDIGDMPSEIPSYMAIDWEKTAENLKVDYTEVDFDGVPYLIR